MKLMVTTKNSAASRPPRTAAFGNHGLRAISLLQPHEPPPHRRMQPHQATT